MFKAAHVHCELLQVPSQLQPCTSAASSLTAAVLICWRPGIAGATKHVLSLHALKLSLQQQAKLLMSHQVRHLSTRAEAGVVRPGSKRTHIQLCISDLPLVAIVLVHVSMHIHTEKAQFELIRGSTVLLS